MNRRQFVGLLAGSAAGWAVGMPALAARSRVRAVAFDALSIFDSRPIYALVGRHFPSKGKALSSVWRTRQSEYLWLRALAGEYADFWQVTESALVFAARQQKLSLTPEVRAELMEAHRKLDVWPDVRAGIGALKEAGLSLHLLSNMTRDMLKANIAHAQLDGVFEHVLSTDAVQTYKPDPRAYRLATSALGFRKDEIVFATFSGWDAAGATWYGFPTFWVNRLGRPPEELVAKPAGIGSNLEDLVRFVTSLRT